MKAGDANPLVAEPETDFNAKWPFKVIQGHLFRYHWRATNGLHSIQYNKCGLRCEGSEDIASERSENLHFDHPTLIWRPSPANPREYPKKTYLARNKDPWATFLSLIVWVYLHANFSGWLRNTCVNATECIIAVLGHFRVNQGRWFWYQSKARIWFPISD